MFSKIIKYKKLYIVIFANFLIKSYIYESNNTNMQY